MEVFHDLTHLVEPLSLDEAYLDVTAVVDAGRFPIGVGIDLKRRVKDETGLDVSVGVGTAKSVAKIASDLQKPDGLVVVPPGQEREFLAPLPVGKLWGIGPKTSERLRRDGINTIGDLAGQPADWFTRHFGKRAESVRARASGQDDDPVITERSPKSISAETTFPNDISGLPELREELAQLAANVAQHLERKEQQGRTVTVKLRLSNYTTLTRQTTLPSSTAAEQVILETAWRLLSTELAAELTPGQALRLLGVGVSSFGEVPEPAQQLALPLA
jgi:DNA polymerase-4